MIKLSIVEDIAIMRATLRGVIEDSSDMVIISEHETVDEAKKHLLLFNPDIVLMDINLYGNSGIEVIREVKSKKQAIQFLMCTVYEDDDKIFESLRAGATGYILKRSSPNEIRESIRSLYNGGSPMSKEIARRVVQSFSSKNQPSIDALSEREKEIMTLISNGLTYKECGDKLFISPATVRNHLHNIYEKLQVKNRTEAANKFQNG